MKVKVDDEIILEIKEWHLKLLKNDIYEEILEDDIKRRIKWIIEHKLERCFGRFQEEWLEKLRNDSSINSIPTSKEDFVNLVTARKDYKNRSQKENLIKNESPPPIKDK